MELISLKYVNNLINIGFEKSKIRSLDIIKQRLILLVDDSQLIIYDLNAEKISRKVFNEYIKMIHINNEFIFVLKKSSKSNLAIIDVVDPNSLDIKHSFDLNDNPYYFTFFEDFNSFNLEIFYVTDKNELVYYSHGYLFERVKKLYNEPQKIDKVR